MATAIGSSWTKLVEYASTDTYTVTYRLYAKYSATSITSNTHTVQLKWTTQKTSGGTGVYDNTSTTPKVTNITNGAPNSWTGSSFTIPAGSAVAETDRTTSGDIIITHNANGTYSATWSWSLSHVYEGGGNSGTVDVTLPTIPRASTFTLSSNSILSNGSTTATITEYDASFNHKITAVYNSTTYYFLGSSSATSSALSASLSVPAALRTAMASANAKSISLTLTLTTYSGSTSIGTSTNSLTITAPTATVSMSASSVNCNANITWTLANTDTTACTYTVTRKYSSITYTDQTKATTTSKAVANANFQTVMPSATSGTVTTTVTTYVGTTTVGTATATYTVKVPTGTYYWNVANGTTTYKGGKEAGKSIAGLESVTQTFTCSNNGTNNSSTVANYDVTCSRSDITLTVTKSSNTITVVTGVLPGSASNYNFTLTCTIADTRGTTKSVTTANILATGYQLPKVSGSATRVNASGVADSTGTRAKVTASATATTATMSSVVIKYGNTQVATGTSSATNNNYNGNFAVTSAYTFTVTATDSFGGKTLFNIQLPVASYEFNLYPGGGAAFGMVASANRVDSAYNWAFIHTSNSTSGGLRVKNDTYDIGLTQGDPTYGNRGLYDYNASTYFVYRNADNNTVLNSNNDIVINSTTYAKGQMVANNGAQTVGFFFKPTNTHADSEVQNPGRIYYQTSVSGYEGRFAFREYSPTSADPTKYTTGYEYYYLPAPAKDMTAGSTATYNILTTKNRVTEAQGGTGQSSLANVTVGNATNATNATNSTLAYRLEGALAGKSGTTTTNRWYKIGTCTITGNNTDITTVIVVSCPYGSLAHGGAQWGIARLKLRSGASGVGMTSGQLEWLGSNNLAPANFKLLIDTEDTTNNRVNELWVYAAGSYQTWTVTKLTESGRSQIQANGAQGWKFTNNYAAEGSSAVTSGLTEVTPTFVLSNGRNLYNNATGTTDAITLSETAANFTYLKIYYYSVHGTTNVYDSTEVYSPNSKQISLVTNVYWSNAMVTTMRQISISGTALSNPSNEQAQFSVTAGSSPTRTTGSLIYIYRIDGFR